LKCELRLILITTMVFDSEKAINSGRNSWKSP